MGDNTQITKIKLLDRMKKYLLIVLMFAYIGLSAQAYDPYRVAWKLIPKIQADSLQALKFFKLNGYKIQLTNATEGQVITKVGAYFKNVDPWTLAFDSVGFDKTSGLLKFYDNGSVAMSDTLDGRYPLIQQMLDSINSISMTKAAYDTLGIGGQIVNTDSVQTLKKKTLIQPVIADFKQATHDHTDSIHGGILGDFYRNVFSLTLPSSSTVAGRCSGAVSGVDYPSSWSLNADGVSPNNLVVHHGLHRHIAAVTVLTVSGNVERQLFGNASFSGIIAQNDSTLTIENLATIQTKIAINLIFK